MGMFFHLYSVLFSIRPPSMCHHLVRKRVQHFLLPRIPRNVFPGSDPPKRQRCIPNSAPKVMRQGMYVLYKNQIRRPARVSSRQCVHRRTSLRAAASRERFQMLGNNYSTSQHPFIASAASIQKGKLTTWLRLPRA
jgi:hypothetical protein